MNKFEELRGVLLERVDSHTYTIKNFKGTEISIKPAVYKRNELMWVLGVIGRLEEAEFETK
jgi:hypothetical protein